MWRGLANSQSDKTEHTNNFSPGQDPQGDGLLRTSPEKNANILHLGQMPHAHQRSQAEVIEATWDRSVYQHIFPK
jgi:hypothetical protein